MQHRFHVEQWTDRVEISGEEFHHARVVRLRDEEEIEIFDGRGRAAAAVVESIGNDVLTARVLRPIDNREPSLRIHLAMAIIHLEKFELVLQKATELGAASLVPLITTYVELRPERYRGKHERWQKIVFEAVKQCGRSVIPTIEEPAQFAEVLTRPEEKILFDLSGTPSVAPEPAPSEVEGTSAAKRRGSAAKVGGATQSPPLIILIGPEGGWSDEELEQAKAAGCALQRLGPRRMRAETAAIAALVAIGMQRGDL